MTTTAPDVLDELDDVIAGLKFGGNKSDAAELESIRTRIAALVDAASVFELTPPEFAHDDQLVTPTRSLPASAYRKLSEALRGIGR